MSAKVGGTCTLAMRATSRASWWMKGMWRPRTRWPRSGNRSPALQPKQSGDAFELPASLKSSACACLGVTVSCGTEGLCCAVAFPVGCMPRRMSSVSRECAAQPLESTSCIARSLLSLYASCSALRSRGSPPRSEPGGSGCASGGVPLAVAAAAASSARWRCLSSGRKPGQCSRSTSEGSSMRSSRACVSASSSPPSSACASVGVKLLHAFVHARCMLTGHAHAGGSLLSTRESLCTSDSHVSSSARAGSAANRGMRRGRGAGQGPSLPGSGSGASSCGSGSWLRATAKSWVRDCVEASASIAALARPSASPLNSRRTCLKSSSQPTACSVSTSAKACSASGRRPASVHSLRMSMTRQTSCESPVTVSRRPAVEGPLCVTKSRASSRPCTSAVNSATLFVMCPRKVDLLASTVVCEAECSNSSAPAAPGPGLPRAPPSYSTCNPCARTGRTGAGAGWSARLGRAVAGCALGRPRPRPAEGRAARRAEAASRGRALGPGRGEPSRVAALRSCSSEVGGHVRRWKCSGS